MSERERFSTLLEKLKKKLDGAWQLEGTLPDGRAVIFDPSLELLAHPKKSRSMPPDVWMFDFDRPERWTENDLAVYLDCSLSDLESVEWEASA